MKLCSVTEDIGDTHSSQHELPRHWVQESMWS